MNYEVGRNNASTFPSFVVENLTGDLGNAFSPGSIQSFAVNNTSIMISGVGYYNRPTGDNLPSLFTMNSIDPNIPGFELEGIANKYFHNGTVFGTAWNGTSWMLTGESSNGNIDGGGAIIISGNKITNLTSTIEPFFNRGGAWFDAWNGTGWLIGGNNDKQAALIGLYHGRIINYTADLGVLSPHSWIQLIVWNGSTWLIGGYKVFGFLSRGVYTNMLQKTEFSGSGVLSALYHGGKWYVGGGSPAGIQEIDPNGSITTLSFPENFTNWVNGIAFYDGFYFVGGETSAGINSISPILYVLSFNGTFPVYYNLTSLLPGSFDLGQIQFLESIQVDGISGVLVSGQGFYNEASGFSTGSLAFITAHP